MDSETDVTFAEAGGIELKLDIVASRGDSQRAAIIYLHGGGWRGGSRDAMRPIAKAMAERGFTGLPAQYRLTGQSPWPAQIHDVKAAIRWTRSNAERLGIDPARIVLWGSSAGAHLALLAGGTPDDPAFEGDVGPMGVSSAVAAVIAVHSPTAFRLGDAGPRHATDAASLMGAAASEAGAVAAGPISHVSERFPPTLLLHGTQDRVVHHSASQAMLDALRAARAPADLHLFHGHNHGFAALPSMREVLAGEAAYFLDRTIIDPAKYAREIEKFSAFAGGRVPGQTPAPQPA